jgi:hypothetical protein
MCMWIWLETGLVLIKYTASGVWRGDNTPLHSFDYQMHMRGQRINLVH